MNVNWNQFYVGTQSLEGQAFKAWKAGVEWTVEQAETGVELPKYDKIDVYDFGLTPEGDTLTLEDIKKLPKEENTIYQFYNGKFMEEIDERIGNKFAPDADQREWVVRAKKEQEERNANFLNCVRKLTPEECAETSAIASRYQQDSENVLNHSFINHTCDLQTLFDKYAIGYAKYLNNDIESAYDDVLYLGFEDEEKYHNIVKENLKAAVSHMLNYFMLGKETEEDIDTASGQLADGVIKYAHQVSTGDRSLAHLDAKVTIKGVDTQYQDILGIQNILYQLNKQGINNDAYCYNGIKSNYDTSGMEELGKKTLEVRKYCKYQLSEEVGNMVLDVYQQRTKKLIEKNHIEFMKSFYDKINQAIKEKLKRTGNYSNAGFEAVKKSYQYAGSEFEQAYNKFAEQEI